MDFNGVPLSTIFIQAFNLNDNWSISSTTADSSYRIIAAIFQTGYSDTGSPFFSIIQLYYWLIKSTRSGYTSLWLSGEVAGVTISKRWLTRLPIRLHFHIFCVV